MHTWCAYVRVGPFWVMERQGGWLTNSWVWRFKVLATRSYHDIEVMWKLADFWEFLVATWFLLNLCLLPFFLYFTRGRNCSRFISVDGVPGWVTTAKRKANCLSYKWEFVNQAECLIRIRKVSVSSLETYIHHRIYVRSSYTRVCLKVHIKLTFCYFDTNKY
jgi:hypothetical protein